MKGPDTQPFRRHDDSLKKSPTFNPGKWAKIRSATSDGGRSRIRDPIYVSCSAFGFEEVVLVLLALGETPACSHPRQERVGILCRTQYFCSPQPAARSPHSGVEHIMTRSTKRVSISLFIGLGVVVAVSLNAVSGPPSARAAESAVGLGNAGSFSVLAAATVTNTGGTQVFGDLGVNAGSAVTGSPPGQVINGTIHATDTLSGLAQQDLVTACNDAAGRTPTKTGLVALDGLTLAPGVYSGGALSLGGTLTLNGGANDVFIFQATSTLVTGSGSQVLLTGGATECNVFWQVAKSATLNTGSAFVGTVMALTSVTAKTGATVRGRLLASTGGVTLDTNVITRPTSCATSGTATPAIPVPGRAKFTG